MEAPLAHPKLTGTRTLLTTGAALAALVVPLGSAAFAQGLEASGLEVDLDKVRSSLQNEGDEEEDGLGEVVEEALTEVLDTSDSEESGGTAPGDTSREMGPAGGSMSEVDGSGGSSGGAQSASQSTSQTPPPPAGDQASESQGVASSGARGGYSAGPRLQQWFSRTAPSIDYFGGPLVAAPLVVPAPAYAEAATVAGLAPSSVDGWSMTATPLYSAVHLNPYTPTEWPLAVAAGMLLLVAGGHVLRLYDRRWKASVVQAPSGPYVTSTD
jgi:hypothetical protein